VTIFKEDFDQERRDREKAKDEAEDYRKQIELLNMKIINIMEQLEKGQASCTRAQKENDKLKANLIKISNEFEALKHQVQPLDTRLYSSFSTAGPRQQHQPLVQLVHRHYHHTAPQNRSFTAAQRSIGSGKWPCIRCTYDNSEGNIKCELCGQPKPGFQTSVIQSRRGMARPELFQCDQYQNTHHSTNQARSSSSSPRHHQNTVALGEGRASTRRATDSDIEIDRK
jgi:hypothetical protein